MKTEQIAVINSNEGLTRDLLYVSNGKLYVDGDVSNNEFNIGFKEPILFKNILSVERTPYAAGVQRVRKVNFDASAIHGFTKDNKYVMTIKATNGWKKDFTVYAPDAVVSPPKSVAEGVRDAFYAQLSADGNPFTVALSTNLMTITGNFGTNGLNDADFTIETPWVVEASPVAITDISSSTGGKIQCTSNSHGLSVGDIVDLRDVTWTAVPTGGDFVAGKGYVITDVTTHTFKVIFAIAGGTYGSGGTFTEVIQASTTDYVKPVGTGAIVDSYLADSSVSQTYYNQWLIKYQIQIPNAPHGHSAYKDVNALIFVSDQLSSVETLMDSIIGGWVLPVITITAMTSVDGSVVTAEDHRLAVGDKIIISNAVANGDTLNGLIVEVTEITDEDTFVIDFDASGWQAPETGATAYIFNPSGYYNAKP